MSSNLHLGAFLVLSALVTPALADTKAPAAPAAAATKMVITPAASQKWQPLDPKTPKGLQISVVHGDMMKGPVSFFLKVPAGTKSGLHAHTNDYYAVVVSGGHGHGANEKESATALAAGSSWFQPGKEMHFDQCNGKQDCVLLVMFPTGGFDFLPGPAADAKPAAKEPAKKK